MCVDYDGLFAVTDAAVICFFLEFVVFYCEDDGAVVSGLAHIFHRTIATAELILLVIVMLAVIPVMFIILQMLLQIQMLLVILMLILMLQ